MESLGFGIGDNLGGSVRVSGLNARELAARGHEVTFWCTNLVDKSRTISPASTTVEHEGVTVHYWATSVFPRWPGALGPHYVALPSEASESVAGLDIVHLCEYRSFLAARVASLAERYQVPFVVQPQGTFLRYGDRRLLKGIYDVVAGRRMRRRAAMFIAATSTEAEDMGQAGIEPDRIAIVPNGIRINDVSLPERGKFRKRYGLRDEVPLLVSVGRVDDVKGFDLMLRAMASVAPPAVYAVVGPDYGLGDRLKAMATELGLETRFILTGALPEARDVMAAIVDADVFVLPSRHEAFGQVILEACLASRPMVLTSGVNSASAFADRAALVVPPEPPALAAAVNRLLGDAELRARFGAEGRRMLDSDYRIEAVAAKLERVYESAISRG